MEKAVVIQEDSQCVTNAFAAITLPALAFLPAEPLRPFDRPQASLPSEIDFSTMILVRQKHETERARKGIRTREDDAVNAATGEASKLAKRKESARQALIRRMQEVLREEQGRAIGTGLERDARWRAHVTAASRLASEATGNSANAALAAGARGAAVCSFCAGVAGIPELTTRPTRLSNDGLSTIRSRRSQDFKTSLTP